MKTVIALAALLSASVPTSREKEDKLIPTTPTEDAAAADNRS